MEKPKKGVSQRSRTYFTPFSTISIDEFEQVNVSWGIYFFTLS